MAGRVRLGCSGWAYPSWRPGFYPEKTPLKSLLTAYAARLNAVEVNYTFRKLPTRAITANWLAQTPLNFHFAFKAPQRITHLLRLRETLNVLQVFRDALEPIIAAGRLGPVLFQLPPRFSADLPLLDAFLAEAAPLELRTAWEFRDASWFMDGTYSVLAERGAALCAAESDTLRSPDLPLVPSLRVFRLRRTSYKAAELTALAEHFSHLAKEGADVYAFFMHEDAPDGPLRAAELLAQISPELLG